MKNFNSLQKKKKEKIPIIMVTAYNFYIAKIIDQIEEIDAILVGDSMANVEYGYESTIQITFEQMLDRVKIVSQNTLNKPVIADMPFLSYGVEIKYDILNCGRMIKEGYANAIKIEGGKEKIELIKRLSDIGVPVQGHIGLKPQHHNKEGGYKIAGKTDKEIEELLDDAIQLQNAGIFSLILECVTDEASKIITESLKIPTIGIGSGKNVDGQIAVINDLLGLSYYIPSFTKKYVDLNTIIKETLISWCNDIYSGKYPEKWFNKKDK
ncbi:MAG: 3-methyl-2-oxobutanoate hydroxymethyltransferase [Spirochaetes bacterium]|nr:3-methyl-2-oxobutanoate hydroxymethyltransferase [Spirochaetota bacterium]